VLAIALARLGIAQVIGVERNERACEVFAENVRLNRVTQQVSVVHADIAAYATPAAASLVVSNPPTIPERPGLPEFVSGAGPDGLRFLRLLFERSLMWLGSEGEIQFVASSLVGHERLAELAGPDGWDLEARGSELVPLRSFYNIAFGTRPDGTVALPDAQDHDGRIFHQSEIITVYRARRGARDNREALRHTM
jgi:methylase of polypeptide subunit release factors